MTAATTPKPAANRDPLVRLVYGHIADCPVCTFRVFTLDDVVPCCRRGAVLHACWRVAKRAEAGR